MPGEDLILGSQMAIFSLCPHEVERARDLSDIFYKAPNPVYEGFVLMT